MTIYKVNDVQPMFVERGPGSDTNNAHGFVVVGEHSRPTFSMMFATQAEAEEAQTQMQAIVARAVRITGYP